MYKLVLLCLFSLLFRNDVEEINWEEGSRLNWSDFKGQPDPQSDAAAITASGISFSYSIEKSNRKGIRFTTKVGAHFYPEHSWYKENDVNAHILAHEQLHFDITELNVRKFRKRLSQIKAVENIVEVLQKEEVRANQELAEMQNKYDLESNYSINKNIQEEWIHYVKTELKKLYAFRSKS